MEDWYRYTIPAGQDQFIAVLTPAGGANMGICTLYQASSTWGPEKNDCRMLQAGGKECIHKMRPAAGTWFVRVFWRKGALKTGPVNYTLRTEAGQGLAC